MRKKMAKPQQTDQEKPRRNSFRYMEQIDKLMIQKNCQSLKLSNDYSDLYDIKDPLGRSLFRAYVSSDGCTSSCCRGCRPFAIKLLDLEETTVSSFSRNVSCNSCFCPCFLQRLFVFRPPEVEIGTVNQQWALTKAAFCIRNKEGDPVFFIRGPWCLMKCCKGVNFKIFSWDGKFVGTIVKKWGVPSRGASTCNDTLEVSFLTPLNGNKKILIIGATFLIEYMYY